MPPQQSMLGCLQARTAQLLCWTLLAASLVLPGRLAWQQTLRGSRCGSARSQGTGRGLHAASQAATSTSRLRSSCPIPFLLSQVELRIARPEQLGGLQAGNQAALTVQRTTDHQHLPPHTVRALVVANGRAVADVLLRGVPADGCIR